MLESLRSAAVGLSFFAAAASASPALAQTVDLDPQAALAGHYILDKSHASVTARIGHLALSDYTFRFNDVAAQYDYDPANPVASQVTVTIGAASIDTGSQAFNTQLAGERFLNADAYPEITFVSDAINIVDGARGQLSGVMTLMGQSRPVTLNVTYRGSATAMGAQKMGFSASGAINRSDFGFDALKGVVSDEVKFAVEVEFVRQP